MAGQLTLSTLSDGTNSTSSTNCIKGSAKAWVNFSCPSSTVTVNGQFNVSSVTRNSTGNYTLAFTTALTNQYYVPTLSVGNNNGTQTAVILSGGNTSAPTLKTTSQLQIWVGGTAGTALDNAEINVAILGG